MFYLLSLLTGVLECGWIAFGIVHGFSFWQVLCYPLAYHIGNLFPRPVSLKRNHLSLMCGLSLLLGSLTSIGIFSENILFWLTCMSLFLLSAVIQSVRSGIKCDGNRFKKRMFRIAGFMIAPLAAVVPALVLVVSSVVAFVALRNYNGEYRLVKISGQGGCSVVMIFHQLHYFFYAHTTLAGVCLWLFRESSWQGIVLGMLAFCGTWLTYSSVEPVVSRITGKVLPVFYVGHMGISLLLFAMSFVNDKLPFFLLWFITGFGGGVVYTIAARAKAIKNYNKDAMTISENVGHTLGILVAVMMAALFQTKSMRIMLVLGALSAVFAVVFMALGPGKEKKYENIGNESKMHAC